VKIGPTLIEDDFAEAFRARCARLVVTAADPYWVNAGVAALAGAATSVIACDCEAGRERTLAPAESPDGRPGAAVLLFAFSAEALGEALVRRTGQCLLTCPTAAAYDGLSADGLPEGEAVRVALGRTLRFFGDGFQKSIVIAGRRFWRIPVMDGVFLVEETATVRKGIAGGNFLIQGASQAEALAAARRAAEAIAPLPGVITPFPGGVVRSGSKVGSRYRKLKASTNDAYCPTLRGRTKSSLRPETQAIYEIVVDGLSEPEIARAMREGIHAACGPGVIAISAGNYGGNLGKFHFRLRAVLA
jgi:formylmethanofuran--tetrahydromethanopterin N-formyltransferase